MENLNIWLGLLITAFVLTIVKIVKYRFTDNRKRFDKVFFTANNWMDYIIHLSVTWAFFYFEHDILSWINPILKRNEIWEIPHPENKGFVFILIPILVSTIGYKLARKFISKPIQKAVAPNIHDEHCNH